jgi:hypothetical protein
MSLASLSLTALLAASTSGAAAPAYDVLAHPRGAQAQSNDNFGSAAALQGTRLVLGALRDDSACGNCGAAFVYEAAPGGWTLRAPLLASDVGANAQFGFALALDRDTIAVGAPLADVGQRTDAGVVYVFVRSGTDWVQQARIPDPDSDGASPGQFGIAVALHGDTLLVGARDGGSGRGMVYAFQRSDGQWSGGTQVFVPSNHPHDFQDYGYALAFDGARALIGAPGEGTGSAFVFRREGADWTLERELVPAGLPPGARYGFSVALSGDRAAVGAIFDTGAEARSGAAWVFADQGTAEPSWQPRGKLVAPGVGAESRVGFQVALVEVDTPRERVLVGAQQQGPGAGGVHAFSGPMYVQHAPLTPSTLAPDDAFGSALAASATEIVVGAPGADVDNGGTGVGRVHYFTTRLLEDGFE